LEVDGVILHMREKDAMTPLCSYCARQMDPRGTLSLLEWTDDHIIPAWLRGRGGRPYGSPVVPCCWHCNQIKGEMPPEWWRMFMAMIPEWWRRPEYQRSRGTSAVAQAIAAVRNRFPNAQVIAVRALNPSGHRR
jgi:hypothetical protein